jgi:four helix bundle protein
VEARGFWTLDVYKRATGLANELHGAVRAWSNFDRWSTGMQLLRSADSIGANIAEAFGRDRNPDQRRFLFIARGSAYEVQHWITAAHERQLSLPSHARERSAEVARMLNGLIDYITTHQEKHQDPRSKN